MSITIKDIAKKTGVSIATVSRAMRPETAYLVKEKTRNEIIAYAALIYHSKRFSFTT